MIGVVVGLRAEANLIPAALGWRVRVAGGLSNHAAAAAATRLAQDGATALLSVGLAGGLDPALRPGDLVTAAHVIDEHGHWFAADATLRTRLGDGDSGGALARAGVLATPAEKRIARTASGCSSVDLESGAVARAARAAGVPFAVLRAISDQASQALPAAAIAAIDPASGIVRPLRVVTALLRSPRQVAPLLVLAASAARARAALAGRLRALAAAMIFLFAFAPVAGAGAPRPGDLCLQAIARAEARYNTPPGLLATIAKVESGRPDGAGGIAPWPWAIDADGFGQFAASPQQAITTVQHLLIAGARFVDVGCLQVDLQMHPAAFRSLDEAFDPILNADYGARFLRALHDGPAHGNWYVATGFYHSATPDLAADYRAAVAAVGLGLVPHWSSASPGLGGPRLMLALADGGTVRLNLHRQPGRRHLTTCQIAAVLGPMLRSPGRC